MDLPEDAEKNVVKAKFDFPGVSKNDIQLDFQNGKLTVSAETKKSEEHMESGFTVRERFHGKVSRTLQLPQGVQVTVTFPKFLPELAPKKIAVSCV